MPAAAVLRLAVMGSITLAPSMSFTAEPRVELELVTGAGFPVGGEQKWISVLKELNVSNLRIRGARPGDQAGVKRGGVQSSPVYYVTGVLTGRNTLELPGGSFTLSDRAGVAAWLSKLRDEGEEGLTATRGAFGLTQKQLVAAHESLAVPVPASTRGRLVADVVRSIADSLTLEVAVDPVAQRVLSGKETVADELKGISSGTAMAAALRPVGLVATLEKPRGGAVRLLIASVRSAEQSWPVGWPLQTPPREAMPGLLKFVDVEIDDVTLAEALTAIAERVGAPFLIDHNSLARQRVDIEQVRVSLPKGRTYYKRIVDQLLSQAGLKSEIRADEAGRPLLWISSIRR